MANGEGRIGKEVQCFMFWIVNGSKFSDERSFKYNSSPYSYEKFVILLNLPKPVFNLQNCNGHSSSFMGCLGRLDAMIHGKDLVPFLAHS